MMEQDVIEVQYRAPKTMESNSHIELKIATAFQD